MSTQGRNPSLPRGVVTFLLTDVESSTRLWQTAPGAAALMERQAALIGAAVAAHGGARPLEQGEGDSLVAVFERPSQALAAAVAAQRSLASEPWPENGTLRVRMAIHSGEAMLREDGVNYGGTAIIRAARLRALAQGGQVLVSNATAALAADHLPAGTALEALDTVTLAGFEGGERVHQLRHPDLPDDFKPLRCLAVRRVPAWPTPLVGREAERREVAALLGTARLLTITGAGGSGKTRLAHAVAEENAGRWRDGVVWVELARLTSGEQVAGAVATACEAPDPGLLSTLEALSRHLAPAELLLLLDNCEHLLGPCAALADALLRAAPGVTLLATSREPLGVAGESSWRIPSLTLPEPGGTDPDRLQASDAVQLFLERARAARPDFALGPDTAAAVERICRRLDGIPLALELAAARVRSLSVDRLAAGLDDRFRLLTGGARTAMARQRTLLASVEWSHDLLDDEERLLFRRLGVFTAPFTLEAAEAVTTDEALDPLEVLDVLARLVDKSLVILAGERYRLLETLRQYALERAGEAGELAALRDRHLEWMRRRAADWRVHEELPTEDLLAEIAAEEPDLLAALDWSIETRDSPAKELLYPLGISLDARHADEELRLLGSRVLAGAIEGSPSWLDLLAPLANELAMATDIAWMPAARAALDTHREALPPALRSSIEIALSSLVAFAGQPEGAAGLRRALADAREAGNRALEAGAAAQLAILLTMIGDRAGARPYLAWLERHVSSAGRFGFLVDAAHALAAAYDGNFDRSLQLVRPGLERADQHAPFCVAGLIAFWTADLPLARRAVAALDRLPPNGMFEVFSATVRSTCALLDGDTLTARRHLEIRQAVGPLNGHLFAFYTLAQIELADGRIAPAEALAAAIEEQVGSLHHVIAAQTGLLRAALLRARGEHAAAESAAHGGLARAATNELSLVITEALEMLALLAADADDPAAAGRMLGAAEAFRQRTRFCWRDGHQGRALAELRERLDPVHLEEGGRLSLAEAVEYAQRGRGERGRPAHGWDSLTPSERRVVELVAAGLSNKAIASQLFVSVATVKTHLIHVFGKLDVRSRAELAAAAVRRAGSAT